MNAFKKNFPTSLSAHTGHLPRGRRIELWWQDEARIGQKNGLVRQWAHFGGAVQDGAQAAAHEAGQDAARRAAPALGEHSRTILSALGYTADEIDHLLHASVVQ